MTFSETMKNIFEEDHKKCTPPAGLLDRIRNSVPELQSKTSASHK